MLRSEPLQELNSLETCCNRGKLINVAFSGGLCKANCPLVNPALKQLWAWCVVNADNKTLMMMTIKWCGPCGGIHFCLLGHFSFVAL